MYCRAVGYELSVEKKNSIFSNHFFDLIPYFCVLLSFFMTSETGFSVESFLNQKEISQKFILFKNFFSSLFSLSVLCSMWVCEIIFGRIHLNTTRVIFVLKKLKTFDYFWSSTVNIETIVWLWFVYYYFFYRFMCVGDWCTLNSLWIVDKKKII